MRNPGLIVLFFIAFLFGACKKDLLPVSNVQRLDSHTTLDRFNKIYFINNSVGFIVGGQRFDSATILMTTDGGYTWSHMSFPNAGKELFGITQAPSGTIYTCGFDGKVLYSRNSGNTWNFTQSNYNVFTDIVYPTAQQGIMVGGISFNSGYIAYIDSLGNFIKWDSLAYQLNRIQMADANTGYICAYGTMLKTTDAGNTWNALSVDGDDFTGISIINNNIWICGYNGCIFHSSDGGNGWQRQRNGNDFTLIRYRLLDILFTDTQNGWAVGEDGVVIHSTDGGANWAQYSKFTNSSLRAIAVCPTGGFIIAGDNGSVFRFYP
jgi:photosystem II stability/assembly factor-like uncharacterized protein